MTAFVRSPRRFPSRLLVVLCISAPLGWAWHHALGPCVHAESCTQPVPTPPSANAFNGTAASPALCLGELVHAGAHQEALALVAEFAPEDRATALMGAIESWEQTNPEQIAVVAEIVRRNGDGPLFAVVLERWPTAALHRLFTYAHQLPAGRERDLALATVVQRGTLQNPAAVAAWLPQLAEPVEFDRAAAYLVSHTDTLFRPTSLALEWAELIHEPALRRDALALVLREWADRDLTAAVRYAEMCPTFSPADREALLASFIPAPDCP